MESPARSAPVTDPRNHRTWHTKCIFRRAAQRRYMSVRAAGCIRAHDTSTPFQSLPTHAHTRRGQRTNAGLVRVVERERADASRMPASVRRPRRGGGGAPEFNRAVPRARRDGRRLHWVPQRADAHLVVALELAEDLAALPVPEPEPAVGVAAHDRVAVGRDAGLTRVPARTHARSNSLRVGGAPRYAASRGVARTLRRRGP